MSFLSLPELSLVEQDFVNGVVQAAKLHSTLSNMGLSDSDIINPLLDNFSNFSARFEMLGKLVYFFDLLTPNQRLAVRHLLDTYGISAEMLGLLNSPNSTKRFK